MSVAIRETPPELPEAPIGLVAKAGQVAALVGGMTAELQRRLADEITQLEAQDALTRTAFAQALVAALGHAAEARAAIRSLLQTPRAQPAKAAGRRRRQLHWRLRWVLARLGPHAQARLIEGSGLWRPDRRRALREIQAYVARRADPGAAPESLMDQAWYLARYPDVAELNLSPLLHYLVVGQGEGRDPHPLFQTSFYARSNAEELERDRAWPLGHFLHAGSAGLRDPHPLFDALHYVTQGALLRPDEDLVSHYLREGWRQGLSPHPLFDLAWYAAQAPQTAAQTPPLLHYVLEGAAAGLSPHPLFDPAWYLAQAPAAAADPLSHYLVTGAAAGLSPSRWFDPKHYAAQPGADLAEGVNPLIDYQQGGAWRVAEPAPGFATLAYVAANAELAQDGFTPLEHRARRATERRRPD